MADTALSARQEHIFQFICAYLKDHGYPPSVREIGIAVGLASPSTVHMHLKTLEELGYIRRDPNKPRTIDIVQDADTFDPESPKRRADLIAATVSLPLISSISAGKPILAARNIDRIVSLPVEMVGDDPTFVMRVSGDSMVYADYEEGDFLVVKESDRLEDGDVVLLLVDGLPAIKTFYQEEEEVRLESEIDDIDPIYLEDPHILGRITTLIRSV